MRKLSFPWLQRERGFREQICWILAMSASEPREALRDVADSNAACPTTRSTHINEDKEYNSQSVHRWK